MEGDQAGRWACGMMRLIAIGVLAWNLTGAGATPVQAHTQLGPNTKEDFRMWTPVFLTVNLPAQFLAWIEIQPRFSDDVSNIDQLLLRPALGYQLTSNLSIWQGYAWISNFNQPHAPPQSPFFEENRSWQQVLYKQKFSGFKFLSRTRLEERWIEHADGTAVRFRQMWRADFPIPPAPEWAFVAYDEIMVNFTTVGSIKGKGPGGGIDQNRLFVGINRTFTQHLNMDIGYQNQMINSRQFHGNANLINHMLLLQFWVYL